MGLITTLLSGIGTGQDGTVTSVSGAGLATGTVTTSGNITVTAATQANQETGTSTAVAVVPGVQQFHASAAKFWAEAAGDGQSILASYNLTSLTDTGVGDLTFNIATDFSSATWGCAAQSVGTNNTITFTQAIAAGTLQIIAFNGPLTVPTDPSVGYMAIGFGDQA